MGQLTGENVLYGRNGRIYLSNLGYDVADGAPVADSTELASAQEIVARVRTQSLNVQLLGDFVDHPRRIGWGGTGDLRLYRVGSHFHRTAADMIDPNRGVPIFDILMQLENRDPGVTVYDEDIILRRVKFWEFDWAFSATELVNLPLMFTFEKIEYPHNIGPVDEVEAVPNSLLYSDF